MLPGPDRALVQSLSPGEGWCAGWGAIHHRPHAQGTRAPGLAVPAQQGMGQVASEGWQGVLTSHLMSSVLPASLSRLKNGCWGLNLRL